MKVFFSKRLNNFWRKHSFLMEAIFGVLFMGIFWISATFAFSGNLLLGAPVYVFYGILIVCFLWFFMTQIINLARITYQAIKTRDENFIAMKVSFKWVLILALLGASIGFIQVMLFEQASSGRYAVSSQCVKWNNACLSYCSNALLPGGNSRDEYSDPPSCDSCCLFRDEKATPLGHRLGDVMIPYSAIAGIIGLIFGLYILEEKERQKYIK